VLYSEEIFNWYDQADLFFPLSDLLALLKMSKLFHDKNNNRLRALFGTVSHRKASSVASLFQNNC
jgi:hypothetical protein